MPEKLRILWINPVGTDIYDDHINKILDSVKRPDVTVEVVHLPKGPKHLEYWSNISVIISDLFQTVYDAEQKGYDAVVIGCFADPGLRGARELVNIPVIGPGEACMHVASTLGHKFSIIATDKKASSILEDFLYNYGLEKKLASIRVVGFTPLRMAEEPRKLQAAASREARKAVEEDNAEVIILGCTAESGFMKELMTELGVPVIDVVVVSFKYAEMLADLYRNTGLSHSKIYGYKSPSEDELFLRYLSKRESSKSLSSTSGKLDYPGTA